MDKRFFQDLGRQFYEWHRDGKVDFEYTGHSKDLELEVERLTGLVDYILKKKGALLRKS